MLVLLGTSPGTGEVLFLIKTSIRLELISIFVIYT